jgi:hypothetical protein
MGRKRKIPSMRSLSLVEQDKQIDRYQIRSDIREANETLASLLVRWVIDCVPDYALFNASGAYGLFKITPSDDLVSRLIARGVSTDEIEKALQSGDTVLNYMPPDILAIVHSRITQMIAYFNKAQPSTFNRACRVYERIGGIIREKFIEQNKIPPEKWITEELRITGDEPAKLFKKVDYQPSLFGDDSNE